MAALAWEQAEAEAYLKAYYTVHNTLKEMRNGQLLVQVINTLLRRMERDNTPVLTTSRTVMAELATPAGRSMVMAAAVDVACNQYKQGTEVTRLRTPLELLG